MDKFNNISPDRLQEMLNAGFICFGRNGYQKAAMSEIAAQAGISKALLFHYFGTKKKLYEYLYQYACNEIIREMTEGSEDFFDCIRLGTQIKLRVMMKHPGMYDYTTVIELICATQFPGELDVSALLLVNAGLLCLHFFIGGICFLASCLFSDTKYSIGFGAGIPVLMFVLKMLSNAGKEAEAIKFVTFFSLFNPEKLATFDGTAIAGILVLFTGAIALFVAAIIVFSKKDLHI